MAARPPGADSFAPGKDAAAGGWGRGWGGGAGPEPSRRCRYPGTVPPRAGPSEGPSRIVRAALAVSCSPRARSFMGWGHGSCPELALAQARANDTGAKCFRDSAAAVLKLP